MNLSDLHVRIIVSDIVAECRVHFFHPKNCDNLEKAFNDSLCQLDGIAKLFVNCSLSRFIKTYRDELEQMRQMTLYSYPELFTGSCTHSPKDFEELES